MSVHSGATAVSAVGAALGVDEGAGSTDVGVGAPADDVTDGVGAILRYATAA